MSEIPRLIDKAIAELNIAKIQPEQYAGEALNKARYLINLALDEARRHTAMKKHITEQREQV